MRATSIWYKVTRGLELYRDMYLTRRTPTIVYTPGHVGSMALYWSLRERGAFVVHVETLDPVDAKAEGQPGTYGWSYDHIVRAKRPAKIITIVRDPISVMISEYFTKIKWIAGVPRGGAVLPLDQLMVMFNNEYFEQGRHLKRLNWYETEIGGSLGIDVYSVPFPSEQKYLRFQSGLYEVLVFRTELDDATKNRVVGEFIGIPDLEIMRGNVGDRKRYGDNYKAFKEQIKVPADRLDEVYNSRYARHFFTDDEIKAARARWGRA